MAKSASFIPVSGFEWKVENVLSINRLESEEFVLCEHRWRLRMSSDGMGYINVDLNKVTLEKLIGRYQVRCFMADRKETPIDKKEHVLGDPNFATKEIWYIKKDTLQKQCDVYLTDGTLTFIIIFTPENILGKNEKVSDRSIQTSVDIDTVADLEDFSLDLSSLMDSDAQSDVTLKCEESSFPAHKVILSARSKVFSAMFRSDMAESRTGVIQISDVDPSVLDQFLRYIYSGKLTYLSVDNAPKLYAAADKYSVQPLKNLCVKFMKENLTRENACRFLVLADTYGDQYLKDCVLCFISDVELLRNKDILFEFLREHPKLATEVMHHAYETKCLSKVT